MLSTCARRGGGAHVSSSHPCCSVPRDSSYTILVFSPRTPTVTRAGRRREGQEGSGIAHCGHRMNTRQKFGLWRVRQILLRSRPQLPPAWPSSARWRSPRTAITRHWLSIQRISSFDQLPTLAAGPNCILLTSSTMNQTTFNFNFPKSKLC